MKMEKMYSEKDLIDFGKFILSKRREESLARTEAIIQEQSGCTIPPDVSDKMRREIHHADLENWKAQKSVDDTKDIALFDRLMDMNDTN
jgi:hypothetical protein